MEGGQSTLIVTPEKRALLVDTGFAGQGEGFKPAEPSRARDARRIMAAAREAGISRIDELLITHFHPDHDGGVSELAQLIPIERFIDHGAPSPEAEATSSDTKAAFETYKHQRAGKPHVEPRPGDHWSLDDAQIQVVSSAGVVLAHPLPQAGAFNPRCPSEPTPPRDPYENPRSTGIVVSYGRFRFLDLGDLSGEPLYRLTCPRSLIGPVDVYLVPHHGGPDVADPSIFAAFAPRVAVMNNGQTKGGARVTYEALHRVPGLEDVWQLHTSAEAGASNFPTATIANLDESTAYSIKLEARPDGSFRVFNQRTASWQSYRARAQ